MNKTLFATAALASVTQAENLCGNEIFIALFATSANADPSNLQTWIDDCAELETNTNSLKDLNMRSSNKDATIENFEKLTEALGELEESWSLCLQQKKGVEKTGTTTTQINMF